MFGAAEVMVLSKLDLAPHVRVDAPQAVADALAVNPRLRVFRRSAYSGGYLIVGLFLTTWGVSAACWKLAN